jgi:hypothetical protein
MHWLRRLVIGRLGGRAEACHERDPIGRSRPDRGARRRGGGVLANWTPRPRPRALPAFPGAVDVDPWRGAEAHRPRPPAGTRDSARLPRELAGRRPVLSLNPGVGDIDLLVASELMEAARAGRRAS